ncbi:MAG: hypothetical protein OXQ90_06870 [Gammaproteobacteria bacterium]|nr:hypothetical protein [Gammaproteobacteria bacterium]
MTRLDPDRFDEQYHRFKSSVPLHNEGRPFTSFCEGVVAEWEDYKPYLRDRALGRLVPDIWTEEEIGSGAILHRTIDAIEVQGNGLTNNLVFWQNRFGDAKREHHVLIESASNAKRRRDLELLLFALYRDDSDEGDVFGELSELVGAKYRLLAYLYFLKDMDRFMPIVPTKFDRSFRDLGIDLVTVSNCSWENYQRFNAALGEVREALAKMDGLTNVRLIDAHSFCWILQKQLTESVKKKRKGAAGTLSREKSIIEMRRSVENTVRNSNGQFVQRVVKNKELRMPPAKLEDLLRSLLTLQSNRCALTGIPLHLARPSADTSLKPSVDRIDSDGQYEQGNLQIVCQFVNFWKADSNNEEFKRLLKLVRSADAVPAGLD